MLESVLNESEFVQSLYRGLLKREPDPQGLQDHIAGLRNHGIAATLDIFLQSDEYLSSSGKGPDVRLNWLSDMTVEAHASSTETDDLWREVESVWTALGDSDPYWSVLTDPKFKSGVKLDAETLSQFHSSANGDVTYLEAALRRVGVGISPEWIMAEYGCGLGRVTRLLAPKVRRLRAFDISVPHLRVAEAELKEAGIHNVELVHVQGRDALQRLVGVDFFFSMIVLQHNPPPVIIEILRAAFAGLNAGGYAFFQVPTFNNNYRFSTSAYLNDEAGARSMEMHFVPQEVIFDAARQEGMKVLAVLADHCVGNYDKWNSNTFLLQKVD